MSEVARIRGLTVSYGEGFALQGLDLDIRAGHILAVIGPSGAGKSTLLRSLAGALPPHAATSGEVATRQPLRGPWVPQLPPVGAHTVEEEGVGAKALDAVGLKRSLGRVRLHDLTIPERQLVSLARVVHAAPPIWLLDQPTSALDEAQTDRVEELLWQARARHAVLLVTHDLGQARRTSDETCLLAGGQLVETTDTATMFVTPSDARTAAFVEGRRITSPSA
jgi:ABC-type phosphate transport system ATPase subunit